MDEDRNLTAAEYVLGTLDARERAQAVQAAQTDPELARAIQDWEHRFAPLLDAFPPVAPQAGVFEKILARLHADDRVVPFETLIAKMTRSRNRWRGLAAAGMAAAAMLLVGFGVREAWWQSQPSTFVAVLQQDAASPAFLLSIDTRQKSLVVRPVKAEAKPDNSYELWLVHDSLPQPKSLGLISDTAAVSNAGLGSYDDAVLRGATYAVSLEPKGGSTTGAPTGPVLFAGKLIPSGL